MRILLRIVIVLLGFLMALPGVLYVAGISIVNGWPLPPETPVTAEQQQEIWRHIEKTDGSPAIERLNPWGFASSVLAGNEPRGSRSVSLVARNYNSTHIKNKRMAYWHLASAAMTIWVSRHWSQDEILSKLYELYAYELPFNHSPKPTQ